MQRLFQLNLLVVAVLLHSGLFNRLPSVTAGMHESADKGEEARSHGSPEILIEKLIRVREMEGFLKSAVLDGDGRLSGIARQSLQQIFAHSYDVFRVDADTGMTRSIRAEALRILRDSPPIVQREWMKSMAVLADGRLQKAILAGDRDALEAVARQFPLTEQGIDAAVLSMTKDLLQGANRDTAERLSMLESDYSGTVLEPFLRQRSRYLKDHLQEAAAVQSASAVTAARRTTKLSIATSVDPGTLAPPWPMAKWEWQESVWDYPGAPQPEAGTVLESYVPETDSSLNEFNNWRPVFWGDTIVLRSPFRLVAFDRISGQQQWSLPTNTYTPEKTKDASPPDDTDELSMGFAGRLPEPSSVGGLASFGLLSCDDEFLFFIDRFDFFRRERAYGGFRKRAFNGNRIGLRVLDEEDVVPQKVGTRLVALRRPPAGGVPSIAWIAGDKSGFHYLPVVPDAANSAQEGASGENDITTRKSEDAPAPASNIEVEPQSKDLLQDHRFLCPPAGTGQKLFALTVNNDQFWLNCLSRMSGHVVWQQPLIFSDDEMHRIWDSRNQASGTSICLLSGETVVCSLAEGILVGVRAADGQLSWATAIRGEPIAQPAPGLQIALPDEVEDIDTSAVLVPCASESVLVCTSNPSAGIYGIDTRTGRILWTAPRRAFGPGDVGDSPDYYIAGISESQVILIGERHCRSLDLKSGNQNWAVAISRTSGRAECRGGRCLIPQSDGQILTLRLKDGSSLQRYQSFFPKNAATPFGAVTSDKDVLCASTPVSLVVFPRVDTMLNESREIRELTEDSAEQIMDLARAYLINGDSEKAFSVLKAAALQASAADNPKLRRPFEGYLADLILQEWGEQFTQSLHRPDATGFSGITTSGEATLLTELNLSSDQQFRSAIMALMSQPGTILSEETLHELAGFREWTSPMFITDSWSVRPDLLLQRSATDAENEMTNLGTLTPFRLRQLAEDGILFPQIFPAAGQRQQFVQRLIAAGEYAAAEAFLGAWSEMAGVSSGLASQPREILTQLRERDVIAGYLPGEVRKHFRPSDAPDSADPSKGLTSETSDPLVFDFQPTLRTASWEQQHLVDQGLPMNAIPEWNRLKYFLVQAKDGAPDLVSMDMSDGSLRDQIALPFSVNRQGTRFRRNSSDASAPGLLPIAGADQLAMFSCSLPDKAKLLWTRRFRGAADEGSVIAFGPLGADHFVWQSGDQMHCSHPLTGRDLWVRKIRLSHADELFSGVQRIFGDRIATVVMGSDASSFERFSTRDGRFLGAGRLTAGRMTDPETIGRYLLYPDLIGRLHLFDGATGLDQLDDDRPILLGPHNTQRAFRVLSEGRVLTVSSGFDIILIDTRQGKVVFRTPAKEHVKPMDGVRFLFGLTAFERNGQLFVGLDDQKDDVGMVVDGLIRGGDPRISSGPLMCLDPASGEILWTTRLDNAVIPPVYGDPTDLLVTISHRWGEDDLRRVNGETLDIQLVNGKTGEVVAKSSPLSATRPVRCVHRATTNTMEIVSKDSVIVIRAEKKSSVAP